MIKKIKSTLYTIGIIILLIATCNSIIYYYCAITTEELFNFENEYDSTDEKLIEFYKSYQREVNKEELIAFLSKIEDMYSGEKPMIKVYDTMFPKEIIYNDNTIMDTLEVLKEENSIDLDSRKTEPYVASITREIESLKNRIENNNVEKYNIVINVFNNAEYFLKYNIFKSGYKSIKYTLSINKVYIYDYGKTVTAEKTQVFEPSYDRISKNVKIDKIIAMIPIVIDIIAIIIYKKKQKR